MKRLILLIVTLATTATQLFAVHLCPSTGRVVDEQGKAVEYATVVLLKGTEQVAGMATDAEGRFALQAAPGEYTLLIQYLGFDPVKKPVRVEQESHLGDFERVLGIDEETFADVKGDAETLAGLMLELKRDFPRKGDVFTSHDLRFTVQEMDGHRVDKIRVDLQ